MTIYREGKAIELTRDEMLQAYNEVLKNGQMSMIEDKIEDAGFSFDSFSEQAYNEVIKNSQIAMIKDKIEDAGFSFDSFSEFDYQSENDFRDDFMAEVFKLFEDYYYNLNYSEQAAMNEAIESAAKEYSLEYNC